MIGFKVNNEFLDLFESTTISVEGESPLPFDGRDEIPGTKVYTLTIPPTKKNKRILKFPEKLSTTDKVADINGVQLYVGQSGKSLWKTGTLKIKDGHPTRGYDISFHTDAGDIQNKISGKKLTDLDLGTEPVAFNPALKWPDVNYTFFPIKNPVFYDDKNAAYEGYVNYYHNGQFLSNTATNKHCLVPFPFLGYIIKRVFNELGYFDVTGDWLEDPEIQSLVIYNNYAIDKLNGSINEFDTQIEFKNHVPEISIGDFIISLKAMGITWAVNPDTKIVEIIKLKDIINEQAYTNITKKASKDYKKINNTYSGMLFKMQEDAADELFGKATNYGLNYRVDGGGEEINTSFSTLFQIEDTDTINARTWNIPHAMQKGSSPEFDLGQNNFSFRLLFYNGLVPDSQGNTYPQGSFESESYTLTWSGPKGLIANFWEEWINFRRSTFKIETEVHLNMIDLKNFNFFEKKMRQHVKYFFGNYRLNISHKEGIKVAQCDLWKVGL